MRVLDLFAGLRGWSEPFAERGHEVLTLDLEPRFEADYQADIRTWDPSELPWAPDVILASPPCEKFSLLALGHAWLPGYVPRHEGTRLAMRIVERTVELIDELKPAFWIIENPVAILRKLRLIPYERQSVTYCQYGSPWRKPTDLWGGFPPSLELRARCRNGDPCHIAAARGSRTGVQSSGPSDELVRWVEAKANELARPTCNLTAHPPFLRVRAYQSRLLYGTWDQKTWAAERAKIPHELALDVCLAAERDLALGRRAADFTGQLFVAEGR